LPEPSAQTRQLVADLARLDQSGQPLTAEQIIQWKQNWQQLVQQRGDSVSAIVEFLKQNKDMDFGAAGESLGYPSARRAMFDALAQIGGAEGVSGTLQALQNTAEPREIALLAQNLEKLAPEEHRQESLQAAREALAMASNGKLEGADVGPLFEVLQKYGGAGITPELEQFATQWKYYGTAALAQLPDGAGVPALIQMAQGNSSGRVNALEMLAQLSAQSPEARAALLEQTRADKIPPNLWPYLVAGLVGDEYHYQGSELDETLTRVRADEVKTTHIRFGNQNLYTAPSPASLTPEGISQRMAFLEELRGLTSDPTALQALHQARSLLAKRNPQTASTELPSR
jgi:hypothetical protein